MVNFIYDLYFTLPEIYLSFTIFIILVHGVLNSGSKIWGFPLLSKSTGFLSIQILVFMMLLFVNFPYSSFVSWNFFLNSTLYILYAKIFLNFACVIWILFSLNYIQQEKINSFEYWVLILISLLALFLILHSFDLLSMYLIIELQSLSFYVLASFKRSSEFSTEAGLKYFVLGAFSSAFLLFGSSLLYGLTGLTNFYDFTILFSGFLLEKSLFIFGVFIGLMFLLTALFFKLSVSPFHMWSPDVYEGSPTSTTAFFSIFPKVVISTLLLKIFFISFHDFFQIWRFIFISGSFLSLLFGSLGAFVQKKWKRFLAYSSINHIGFVLMGFLSGELFSSFSILMYLFIYIWTMFAIFSLIIDLRVCEFPSSNQIRYMREITSLGKINPFLSFSLILILFSMAGIPPLSGFFSKVFVILVGIQSGAYNLVIFSVIMSSIACFYYIRIIQSMYFVQVVKWPLYLPLSKVNSIILGTSCFFILFYFLDIELFSIIITRIILTFT